MEGLIATAALIIFRYVTKLPAKPATDGPWLGRVFEGSGDLPRCVRSRRFGVSLQRLLLGGLLPSRARFRFTGTDNGSSIPLQPDNQRRCGNSTPRVEPRPPSSMLANTVPALGGQITSY